MRFSNKTFEDLELTFDDVFIFQNYFDGSSRIKDTNIIPNSPLGTSIPIISSNMNQVTGKRMCETLARYGGIGVLPQDMELDKMLDIVSHVKNADIRYDTPLTVTKNHYVRDAKGIINKRAHNAVILIDDNNIPIALFTPHDLDKYEQYELLGNISKNKIITGKVGISDEEAFNIMDENNISSLAIVNEDLTLKGILTKANAIRNSIYKPTLDKNGKLNLAVALGINSFIDKAKKLVEAGVNIFVLDTAHGYQKNMIEAIKLFRKELGSELILIAGNLMTGAGVEDIIKAGANGVKVGIGPGAMCTTRIMTGVGRPQFSAILDCSKKAIELGGFVIADGGIRHPRDLSLSCIAGASHAMIGTIFTGTFESTGDIFYDTDGLMYKKNYGMASKRAVNLRNSKVSKFEQARKQIFVEGISDSKIYLKKGERSVGDIVDKFTTGLRSSMTYIGANSLKDFNKNAVIGVQTDAGFTEGTPHGQLKK